MRKFIFALIVSLFVNMLQVFGADVQPNENWYQKYQAEAANGTLVFKAGVHKINWTAKLTKPMTFRGEPGAILEAVNPRDGKWMFVLERGIPAFTFTDLYMKYGGVSADSGGVYKNITITRSTFENMQHAFKGADSLRDSTISLNTFKEITGYATVNIYDLWNVTIEKNRYINCSHGGHILGPRDGVVLRNNYATGLQNWLFEIQDSGPIKSNGMLIENNVAYGYRKAFGNTGGLSVVNIGNGTIIRGNYLRADFTQNAVFSEGHLHVAIEWNINSTNATASANVVGSARGDNYVWEQGIGYHTTGITTNSNNQYFGKFNGGWGGNGKPTNPWPAGQNNTWNQSFSAMPAPPSEADIIGGGTIDPVVLPITWTDTTVHNMQSCTFTWKINQPGATRQIIEVYAPGDASIRQTHELSASTNNFTFTDDRSGDGWVWNATITTLVGSITAKSEVQQVRLTGGGVPPEPGPTTKPINININATSPDHKPGTGTIVLEPK